MISWSFVRRWHGRWNAAASFFVHNRVQSIHRMADTIAALAPQARIGVAHGQMPGPQLEDIMVRFINHEIDVLVCTTIIESGLDISNANTIIINRADHLGLADIYQLRGRVGRSSRQAYCLPAGRLFRSFDAGCAATAAGPDGLLRVGGRVQAGHERSADPRTAATFSGYPNPVILPRSVTISIWSYCNQRLLI